VIFVIFVVQDYFFRRETMSDIVTFGTKRDDDRRVLMAKALRSSRIPDSELMMNLGLYLTPQTLGRILFFDFLFRQIREVQGVIMEFGCRWGQTVAVMQSLRGIYEPFNRLRKIIGFDTFEGLKGSGGHDVMKDGQYEVPEGYDEELRLLMELQEEESPLPHIPKKEIITGDVRDTVPKYLKDHPETIIALAYFDLDIYEPTHDVLNSIQYRLTKGSVVGFDELNDPSTPGETVAFRDWMGTWANPSQGIRQHAVKRFPASARTSYIIIE